MPQFSNEYVEELLSVGPFEGLDSTTSQYFVENGMASDLLNFVPDRNYQSLVTAQGRTLMGQFSNVNGICRGFAKFVRQGLRTLYVAIVNQHLSSLWDLQAYDPIANTVTSLPMFLPLVGAPTNFVAYASQTTQSTPGWLFGSDGNANNFKINAQTLVTSARQITPPGNNIYNITGAIGANLNGTYYYRYTYSNAEIESSPSPISNPITVTNGALQFSSLLASTDPQVTTINIYRLGGTLGTWLLIGTQPNTTGLAFIDNQADLSVTGQSLVLHRDPPANFLSLEVHKERVWGFGYRSYYPYQYDSLFNGFVTTTPQPSDLWYSNYAEPWGWDNTNQVIPIGRNTGGDVAVGLATMGSLLICFKSKTTWAIYGDTQADFIPRRLFDIGCAAPKSITKAYGLVFWLSERGVYGFDGGDAPVRMSKDIRSILATFTTADLAAAVGFMNSRMYWLSFPTQNITLGVDIDTNKWFKLGWATDNAVWDPLGTGLAATGNLPNEVTALETNSGLITSWFNSETDLGVPITSVYQSRISDSGQLGASKQYRYAVVEAPIQTASVLLKTIIDGNKTDTRTLSLNSGSSPRVLVSLPPNLSGFEAQIIMTVTSSAKTEIHRAALSGYIKRRYVLKR